MPIVFVADAYDFDVSLSGTSFDIDWGGNYQMIVFPFGMRQ